MHVVGNSNTPGNIDLTHLSVFNNVPADLLQQISPEMICFYQDGDVIFAEGGQADHLVILLRGQVRVVLDGIFLVTRLPYAVLGEQAFINKTTRSATVIAQGMVQALVL